MAKKCTKKRDALAKLLFLVIKPIAFLTSSLPSPSLGLKVPNSYFGDSFDNFEHKRSRA